MTFQEPGGQLLRQPQSLEFEQNLGFTTHFEIHGQFRDITVDYRSVKTEAGSEEARFDSPSNSACWLKVGYIEVGYIGFDCQAGVVWQLREQARAAPPHRIVVV